MSRDLSSSATAFLADLEEFDPRLYDCGALVELLSRVGKAVAGACSRAAAHASARGEHRAQGYLKPADWLAKQTGTSTAEAERDLLTAQQLDDLPQTSAAVKSGALSMAQASEVAKTVKECPGTEFEMLALAHTASLRDLKETGRKKRLLAVGPEDLHRRQHVARTFRHWRDDEGMVCGSFKLTPEVGVPLMNRIDVETDRAWRKGYREGCPESNEQHAADAFVTVMAGGGKPHAQRADVVFVANVDTGEAHIVGGGPVPMSTVRAAAKDAFVKALLHDGTKVDTIVHYGRKKIPATLMTILNLGAPPKFDGLRCIDCGRTYYLEVDHKDPVVNEGPTCADNLDGRCKTCHREKSERERRARGQPP